MMIIIIMILIIIILFKRKSDVLENSYFGKEKTVSKTWTSTKWDFYGGHSGWDDLFRKLT